MAKGFAKRFVRSGMPLGTGAFRTSRQSATSKSSVGAPSWHVTVWHQTRSPGAGVHGGLGAALEDVPLSRYRIGGRLRSSESAPMRVVPGMLQADTRSTTSHFSPSVIF